jgi:hypothetical protein
VVVLRGSAAITGSARPWISQHGSKPCSRLNGCGKMTPMRTSRSLFGRLLRASGPPPDIAAGSGPNRSQDAGTPTTRYLADLLEDTREELTRADYKAGLLLAATGIVASALLAGLISKSWTPFELDTRISWLWWVGVSSAGSGMYSIAAAVYPRIHRRGVLHPQSPAYYGDVAAYDDVGAFRRAIGQVPDERERLIDQTFLLSHVVQHKYILLRRGLRCLLLAILACAAAVIINFPLSH